MTANSAPREQQLIEKAVQRGQVDPVWYCTNVLKMQLDPWQVELYDAVGDVVRKQRGLKTRVNHKGINKVSVRAMHGPGKTFGAGGLMAWFGLNFRGLSPCTAPKEKQLHTRLWPAFRKVLKGADPELQNLVEVNKSQITFCGDPDWGFVPETAREPENMAGYHDDYMLIVVDEASGLPEEMFPVIEGAMSTGVIVILVMIGNPTRNIGTFHDSHRRVGVRENYFPIHVTLEKAPRVSREWVRQMGDKYGKDSPVYRVRCLGEFAETDENQLIALEWLQQATDKEPEGDGSHPITRISADIADGGEDSTVITITRHYESVTHWVKQYEFNFPTSQAPILSALKCIEFWKAWNCDEANGDTMIVDGLGVGAGTAGYLIKNDYPVVVFKGGEKASSENYRNMRAQSYIAMRDDLREGRVVICDDFLSNQDMIEFEAQLCSIRTAANVTKWEDLETKVAMKRRGIKSPDRADSTMMAYAVERPNITGERHKLDPAMLEDGSESETQDGDAYLVS